jgi:hypothetical protein
MLGHLLVRFDHVAGFIVNANHSVMRAAEKLRVAQLHFGSTYHKWLNGGAEQIRSKPRLSLRGLTS